MRTKTDMSRDGVTHRLKQMEGLWLLGKALGRAKVSSNKGSQKNQGLEIQAAIRYVLVKQWDPISVSDEVLVDEYDAYIAPLYRILVTTRDYDQLIKTLQRIERDELGVEPSDAVRLRPVAEALLNLKVMLR